MTRKPVIGITPSPADVEYDQSIFNMDYASAVEAAGGIPVILPLRYGDLFELLSAIDGVLLIGGGGDVGPHHYGDETLHPTTAAIHDRRDELEISLVRAAVARDIPFLSICRGSQILNVASGGTMYQDIRDQHGSQIEHAQAKFGVDFSQPSHLVNLETDSLLARVYGTSSIETNSDHHQASKEPGPEIRIVGRAPDGVIEAVERPASRFMLGMQWHPELMFVTHPEHLRPFSALVDAARVYRDAQEMASVTGI